MAGRSRKPVAALVLGCVLALACSSARDWRGQSIDDVIATLGPATRIMPYPFGGRLYVWEHHQLEAMPGPVPASAQGVEVVVRESFRTDERGVVLEHRHDRVAPILELAGPGAARR